MQEGQGPLLFSVLVAEGESLDVQGYLFALSHRIQNLIDNCDSPRQAAKYLMQLLEEGGLLNGPIKLPDISDAANDLVSSNPPVLLRFEQHGLPENLASLRPIETLAAGQELLEDRADPLCRLESWASALGVMP